MTNAELTGGPPVENRSFAPRAALFGALAAGIGFGAVAAVLPREPSSSALIGIGWLVFTASMAASVVVRSRLSGGPRPARFARRDGTALVPLANYRQLYSVALGILGVLVLGSVAVIWWLARPKAGGRPGYLVMAEEAFSLSAMVAYSLLAVFVVVWTVSTLRGRARFELTAAGLVDRAPFQRRAIPWAAIRPPRPGELYLIDRPELTSPRGLLGWSRYISTRNVYVEPVFLAAVVRYYIEHPEHRAGIGTEAEYDRLLAALGAGARS